MKTLNSIHNQASERPVVNHFIFYPLKILSFKKVRKHFAQRKFNKLLAGFYCYLKGVKMFGYQLTVKVDFL